MAGSWKGKRERVRDLHTHHDNTFVIVAKSRLSPADSTVNTVNTILDMPRKVETCKLLLTCKGHLSFLEFPFTLYNITLVLVPIRVHFEFAAT